MKDYRITVKVRNNRILKAVEETGSTFGGKWCEANGVDYHKAVQLVAMTASPINEEGHLIKAAVQLCDALNKTPDDLWSKEQIYPLEKNFSELEMDHEQVLALLPNNERFCEHDTSALENDQQRKIVETVLASLTKREEKLIKLRFDSDLSLAECADRMHVSQERVRQIEKKALRKLRDPSRRGMLVDLLDVEPGERAKIKKVANETSD